MSKAEITFAVLFSCTYFCPLKYSVFGNVIVCSLVTVYQKGEPHASNVRKPLCQCCTRARIVINIPLFASACSSPCYPHDYEKITIISFELHIEVLNVCIFCFSNRLQILKGYFVLQTDSVFGSDDRYLI